MALIKCSECGQMISDRAARCPKCGCPVVNIPVPPVQQPQARPQRPQQPQAAQPQPAPQPVQPQPASQVERPQPTAQQPVASPQPQKQGRGKTIAIVLLSVALIVLIVVFLFLLLRGKDTPAETMRISSQNVTTMSAPSAPSTSQSSSSSASGPSGGYTSEISGSRRYDGDIEGIKCYFSLYFGAKDDGGEQDVSGSYYYKKSGSDHPLCLRGTYYEETGVLFLREYLEDGSPHASMEVNYNKYSGNFSGTFTRYTGERMSISMRGI